MFQKQSLLENTQSCHATMNTNACWCIIVVAFCEHVTGGTSYRRVGMHVPLKSLRIDPQIRYPLNETGHHLACVQPQALLPESEELFRLGTIL